MFDTATTKAGKELDKLNQKIEVQTELGFRPLAGIMVLIMKRIICIDSKDNKFPSPCGDYGSYRIRRATDRLIAFDRFRPLAGIMVLIGKYPKFFRKG